MTSSVILADVQAHIANIGGAFQDWYVGLTDDYGSTALAQHNVDTNTDKNWLICAADSNQQALFAMDGLLALGLDGVLKPPSQDEDTIYIYKKGNGSNP